MSNEQKVRVAVYRIAFLMGHQNLIQEQVDGMEEEAFNLAARPSGEINKESPEYLAGAMDALLSLTNVLAGKSGL